MSETWVINEYPNQPTSDFTANINFTSNNVNFTQISTETQGEDEFIMFVLKYENTQAYFTGGWENENYRTITFETTPMGDLLTWLQANAVKQEPPQPTGKKVLKINSKLVSKVNDSLVASWNGEEIFATPMGEQPQPTSYKVVVNDISYDTAKCFISINGGEFEFIPQNTTTTYNNVTTVQFKTSGLSGTYVKSSTLGLNITTTNTLSQVYALDKDILDAESCGGGIE